MRQAHERFNEELREWGSRPPRKSARLAARDVRRQITRSRRAFLLESPRLTAAAAVAAALIVALSWWLVLPSEESGPTPPDAPTVAELTPAPLTPAPLSEGVVLIWLDPKTPLYMTFAAPRPSPGAAPGSPKGDAS